MSRKCSIWASVSLSRTLSQSTRSCLLHISIFSAAAWAWRRRWLGYVEPVGVVVNPQNAVAAYAQVSSCICINIPMPRRHRNRKRTNIVYQSCCFCYIVIPFRIPIPFENLFLNHRHSSGTCSCFCFRSYTFNIFVFIYNSSRWERGIVKFDELDAKRKQVEEEKGEVIVVKTKKEKSVVVEVLRKQCTKRSSI